MQGLSATSTPYEILTTQETNHANKKAYENQQAVNKIGVEQIVESVEEKYAEQKNGEHFRYANKTINSMLLHIRTTWYKLFTKEKSDARTDFY